MTAAQSPADTAAAWQRIAAHFAAITADAESVDALKAAVLQLAVQGRLVPQDPRDEPASALLERIAAEKALQQKKGEIRRRKLPKIHENYLVDLPSSWTWCQVGDILQVQSGYAFKSAWFSNSGIRLVRNNKHWS